MENYSNHQVCQSKTSTTPTTTRANFLYPSCNIDQQFHMNNNAAAVAATSFHLQWGNSDNTIYHQQQQDDDVVKIEASGSHHHNNNNNNKNNNNKQFNHHLQYHPTNINMSSRNQTIHHQQQQQQSSGCVDNHHDVEAIKVKIIAHPQYSNLLEAYMDCQKVGAPPEVMERLAVAQQELEKAKSTNHHHHHHWSKDPELDQFMEAYCDMLVKYREELTRPIQEAMDFMRRIESQLNMLASAPIRIFNTGDEKCEGIGSSEEDQENSGGETDQLPGIDPRAEDRELKNHLLKKYSGYLSSLKQELSKKKKKGKLPKDARQKLLSWWEVHYKWPYPSETEKFALAETTGLDQKQINNWFINQRKRHWKPSEDLQFMVMEGLHPQNTALYMDGHYLDDGPYRLGP